MSMITRRHLINGVVAATAVGLGSNLLHGCGDRRTSHNQGRGRIGRANYPNILILLIDDLRPELNCYGRSEMISPNIDRLAAEGTLFERAYCQVPICGASRASTLSGARATPTRFGSDYQARKDVDMPNEPSLPRWFKDKGYRTISHGKIYHVIRDDADSWLEEPWRPQGMWGLESYVTPENRAIVKAHGGTYRAPIEMTNVADNIYADGRIADRTVRTFERLQDGHAPFFIATGLLRPHLPFNSPTPYWNLYQRENLSLADNPFRPAGAPDAALHNWGELRYYYGIPAEGPLMDDPSRRNFPAQRFDTLEEAMLATTYPLDYVLCVGEECQTPGDQLQERFHFEGGDEHLWVFEVLSTPSSESKQEL
ncbi:MAG: sulfatase-like hydrolase/transferase [Phormidium sp. BM_Day4_Bin.17]|nr:sulfatase-like hydrolase/transferase [Phormidium sp. BM_Day4_Bin.17]UCJ10504.1 MAG: sulfatase-like hydrolase/transferase [Phormidium sp. PBR-2020]